MKPVAAGGAVPAAGARSLAREYPDNRLALQLFGSHHVHLARIEHELGVRIDTRGNKLTIMGAPGAVATAAEVLDHLYGRLERGLDISDDDVDAAVRMTASHGGAHAVRRAAAGVGQVHRIGKMLPQLPLRLRRTKGVEDPEAKAERGGEVRRPSQQCRGVGMQVAIGAGVDAPSGEVPLRGIDEVALDPELVRRDLD